MRVQTAIVGAGIGGMTVAIELVTRGAPPEAVALFDRASDSHGRLETAVSALGTVCELGAARFHPELHPRLAALAGRFGLELGPFSYRTTYDPSITEEVIERFRRVELAGLGHATSFIAALENALGYEDAELFCSLVGYGALKDPRFPVDGGCELVHVHPESFMSDRYRQGWVAPKRGFRELAERMQTYLVEAGVAFNYGVDTRSILDDGDRIHIRFESTEGGGVEVGADQVVLAIPPGEIGGILHQWSAPEEWASVLHQIPVFKCFLAFDPAHWPFGTENVCMITRTELQKLYLDSQRACAFFFCDSDATEHWRQAEERGYDSLLAEVRHSVEECVGAIDWSGLLDVFWKYWRPGVTYFSEGSKPGVGPYSELSGRAFVVGDAFTSSVGWIEGALISANSVVDRLHGR